MIAAVVFSIYEGSETLQKSCVTNFEGHHWPAIIWQAHLEFFYCHGLAAQFLDSGVKCVSSSSGHNPLAFFVHLSAGFSGLGWSARSI